MKEIPIVGIEFAVTGQVNALLLNTDWYQCPSVRISGSTAFFRFSSDQRLGVKPLHLAPRRLKNSRRGYRAAICIR